MILHSFNYLRVFKKQLRHVFFLFESIKIFLLFSSQHHEIRYVILRNLLSLIQLKIIFLIKHWK